MTDQNAPITNGQTPNPTVQQPKKNFFGGEVNFNDANFEVHGEQAPQTPTPETEEIAPTPYASEAEKAEEIISFEPEIAETPIQNEIEEVADFDPFGDDEDSEVVETVSTLPEKETQVAGEEFVTEENPTEETVAPAEEDEDGKEEDEENDGETIEFEPTTKTGNELFDKFLSLTDTARAIFALQEDKSNFKIIGGKTSDNLLEYFVYLIEDETDHIDLFIKKVETQEDEEDEHLLQRSYTTTNQHLDIFVDEMLLYQFTQDNKEANGVLDKLNKF
ncbi:MAG: hypothetical protein LBO09_00390 [Candidatus Peribacteria bacterium]|nr:hypothetical protein [Candidatus Peribacteria bacterium]